MLNNLEEAALSCQHNSEIEARNMKLIIDSTKAFNARKFDKSVTGFSPAYTWHSPLFEEPVVGVDATVKGFRILTEIFPDVIFKPRLIFANGNYVETLFEVSGDRVCGLMGAPSVDCTYKFFDSIINIFNEEGERLESWELWDRAGMLQVMKFIPDSFANKTTVLIGGHLDPANQLRESWNHTESKTPAGSHATESSVAEIPLPRTFPPNVDPFTYKTETVTRLFDQVADLDFFLLPGSGEKSESIKSGTAIAGARLRTALHRMDVSGATAVIGHSIGRVELEWQIIPENSVAFPDSEAPSEPFVATRSQRCLLKSRFELEDTHRSSVTGFGTGRTFPSTADGESFLGVVMNISDGTGAFRGVTGLIVINGKVTPSLSLKGDVLLRVRDSTLVLQTDSNPARQKPIRQPDPGITTLTFFGDMNPKNPVTLNLTHDGQMQGANGHERLRLVTITSGLGSSGELVSRTQKGAIVGEIAFKVFFNAFAQGSPLPYQTRNAVFRFVGRNGQEIGHLEADMVDGRAFPVDLPGAPMRVFKMGGIAPILQGTGIFEDARGLITANVWLSLLPRVINDVVVARLEDPKGRLRKQLRTVWR